MARRPGRDLTIGVVAALALAILAFAILAVGEDSALFSDRATYDIYFPSTEGLVVGSPVMLAGVQVGIVSGIRLPTEPGEAGVHVRVGVDRRFAERIREDSRAALRILQFLSGEKYVEITPGDPGSNTLAGGATIPLLEEQGMFEQGENIAQNLNEITNALAEILGPMQRGEGLLGQMIRDPDFGKEGLERLSNTVANLEALTGQLRRGEGFVGRALYDQEFAGSIDDLSASMASFKGVAECLSPQQGSLCELFAADGSLEQAVADLRDAAGSLKRITATLESDQGLIGRLLNDPEYSRQLSGDLERALDNVNQITAKINEGEGTLGALVNERNVHTGMEQILAGVNDSKFARWLIRRYQKKGIKARERAAEQAEPETPPGSGG